MDPVKLVRQSTATVKVSYSPDDDMAYVKLANAMVVDRTLSIGPYALDVDALGALCGIEVFRASTHLPPELLEGLDV